MVPVLTWYTCWNTSSSDTPITISGVTSGNSIRKLDAPDPRPRQRARPSASITPSTVATTMSAPASFRLWTREWRRSGLCHTESTGSPQYQRVENPAQDVRDRLALNENWIAISTGTIDQMTYSQVISTRKRGFPHGLVIHPRSRAGRDRAGGREMSRRWPRS